MGRIYTVPYNGTLANASGDIDLLSIQPADDKPCRLLGWSLGQTSETGDAAEENIRLSVRHMTATVTIGSGGSSVTPQPPRPGFDVAAGFTARCNDGTVATSSGNNVIVDELGWNIRSSPWIHHIDERRIPRAVQGEAIIVRLESTLADDVSGQLTFYVEEEG